MKEKYERIELTVTRFPKEDIITTSDINNAYRMLSELFGRGDKDTVVPTR